MIRRVKSEQGCEGMHIPEGYSERTRPMNIQELRHLCQLIRDTQEGLQELVALCVSPGSYAN